MKPWIAAAVVLALGVPLSAQAQAASPHQAGNEEKPSTTGSVFPSWMAGRWTANPFEVTLSDDFHRSVYGPNAKSVRLVNMTLRPTGEGIFTVTSSVRDRAGRTVPGTREIDEVQFTIGGLKREAGYQPRYSSEIVHAERKYPDDPKSAFPLDGVKLELFVPEGRTGTFDVRFDTPEGRGSFWETLHRARATGAASQS